MKKIDKSEIDFEKRIYDQHYRNIETGWDYMRKNGYAHGGWQMLAKQAVVIRNIYVYILEIAKALKIDIQKVDEIFTKPTEIQQLTMEAAQQRREAEDSLFKSLFPSLPECLRDEMITLNDACFELSNEGYDITFDPYRIRQYLNRHSSYFEGCWRCEKDPHRRNKKYFVKKEMLLKILTTFPYQNSLQKKLINKFAEWRKTQKAQGHC